MTGSKSNKKPIKKSGKSIHYGSKTSKKSQKETKNLAVKKDSISDEDHLDLDVARLGARKYVPKKPIAIELLSDDSDSDFEEPNVKKPITKLPPKRTGGTKKAIAIPIVDKDGKPVMKHCTKCDQTKNVYEFHLCKTGYRYCCKNCSNEMSRNFKANNKKYIADFNKKWKAAHKDDVKAYNHDYNKNNRETIQPRQTLQHRIRRETDKKYKIACDLRRSMYYFVKSKGETCDDNIDELIGCGWNEFEAWLTTLFDIGMNMDNYGKEWSIDHIRPCSTFDLTRDTEKYHCFHWSNLRPMQLLKNQEKNNTVDQNLIDEYAYTAATFIKYLPEEDRRSYTILPMEEVKKKKKEEEK